MILWTLWHSKNSNPQKDCQLLGIFSSLDNIHREVERLMAIEPFLTFPDGLTVDKHTINEINDALLIKLAEQGGDGDAEEAV